MSSLRGISTARHAKQQHWYHTHKAVANLSNFFSYNLGHFGQFSRRGVLVV
jgi:hypothetical protein